MRAVWWEPDSARTLTLASAYAGWAGSLPPSEGQRRIRLALQALDRPVEEAAREFVATLLPVDAPQCQVEEQLEMITQARPATTRAMLTHVALVDVQPLLPLIDVQRCCCTAMPTSAHRPPSLKRCMPNSRDRCWCS